MVFRRWALVVTACLLLLAALGGYKFVQVRKMIAFVESFPEASETIELFSVSPQSWQESSHTVGEVLAPQSIALRNEVEGRVIAVGFAAGDQVKKDQMLLQLDASEEIAQLRGAQADTALAQQSLLRYEKLTEKNVSSREQFDQARAQFALATARSQALQAVINKKTLTAPFDARAGLHTLQAGQYLAANTLITQLVGNQQILWVDFSMPQQLANITVGTSVSVTAREVLASPLKGNVIAIDPSLSTASRNIKLRAAIDNTSETLKPGMLVDVEVTTSPMKKVFSVPATAIQYSKDGTYVFVIVTDDKNQLRAKRREVKTSSEKSGYVLVESGLSNDEQIAANGAYKLHDGMLAKVKQPNLKPVEKSLP
jgi:membrane fusion protein (multidrug efflux system)